MFKLLFTLILVQLSYAKVNDVSVQWDMFLPGTRLLEMPKDDPMQRLSLNVGLDYKEILYLNTKAHLTASSDQVRWVGGFVEAGFHLYTTDFYYQHHSQHCADCKHPFMRFPVENLVGVRWRILK